MNQRLKKHFAIPILFLAVFIPAAGIVSAQEDQAVSPNKVIERGLCGGSGLSLTNSSCSDAALGNPEEALNVLITRVVNLFSVIVGIVAVIMIIVGGFKYITSGGDSSNVSDAKNTILYAIVGLIIVAISQFIVRFVLRQATNLDG
jgi:hypothetical protein